MKKFLSSVVMLVMVLVCAFSFTACGNRTECEVVLPTKLPVGVKSVTCTNTVTTEDGETKFGCGYDGSYNIVVELQAGYKVGSLELKAGSKVASENPFYTGVRTDGNSIIYIFENVKKNITFSLVGKPELIDYKVTLSVEDTATETNDFFNETMFQVITNIGGTENKSNEISGAELKAGLETDNSFTMNIKDTLTIVAYRKEAYKYVLGGFMSGTYTTSYEVGQNGIIKSKFTYNIAEDSSIIISADDISSEETKISADIIVDNNFLNIPAVILNNNVELSDSNKNLSAYKDLTGSFSLKLNLNNVGIYNYIFSNYENNKLSFLINGKIIEKTNLSYAENEFIVSGLNKTYSYVTSDGEMDSSPAQYTLTIAGLEEFLASNPSSVQKISYGIKVGSVNTFALTLKNNSVLNYYLTSENVTMVLSVAGEYEDDADIIITNKNNETITIKNIKDKNSCVVEGITIIKATSELKNEYTIIFDKDFVVSSVYVEAHK